MPLSDAILGNSSKDKEVLSIPSKDTFFLVKSNKCRKVPCIPLWGYHFRSQQ